MNDQITTISDLKERIEAFGNKRGWTRDKEITKDIVMALSVEASELLEIFQWVHSDKANALKDDPKEFEHIKEEVADITWYLLRFCTLLDIDLTQAILDKEIKNARKYPAIGE